MQAVLATVFTWGVTALGASAVFVFRDNKVPVAGVAVLRDGKVQWAKIFGERESGEKASAETIFNVSPGATNFAIRLQRVGFIGRRRKRMYSTGVSRPRRRAHFAVERCGLCRQIERARKRC